MSNARYMELVSQGMDPAQAASTARMEMQGAGAYGQTLGNLGYTPTQAVQGMVTGNGMTSDQLQALMGMGASNYANQGSQYVDNLGINKSPGTGTWNAGPFGQAYTPAPMQQPANTYQYQARNNLANQMFGNPYGNLFGQQGGSSAGSYAPEPMQMQQSQQQFSAPPKQKYSLGGGGYGGAFGGGGYGGGQRFNPYGGGQRRRGLLW